MTIDTNTTITPRQLELLALYASGHQQDEIADMKFLSPFTVRNILSEARIRSGCRTLPQLCAMAVHDGLIKKNGHGYKPVQIEGVIGE